MLSPCNVSHARRCTRLANLVLLAAGLLLTSATALGQQTFVPRFDTFIGYTFLDSPHVSLFENGVHFQFGVRPRTWCSLGFDYSVSMGDLTLTPNLLTTAWQQKLGAALEVLAPAIPPGFVLSVPTHSHTQTFAVGPQLAYRRFSKITLFVRPDLGAIYERATPQPNNTITKVLVPLLVPSGYKTDWTPFGGFGGGVDLLFSNHLALRVQADLVYDHLFSDLLKDGRLTTRFSIGPCFNFGKNIRRPE